jgi:hypothetical protein
MRTMCHKSIALGSDLSSFAMKVNMSNGFMSIARRSTCAMSFLMTMMMSYAVHAQTAAASNYGSFTVGGSSTSYYAVQFTNNVTSYGAPNPANTSDLVIYRSWTHQNGTWYGTFNLVISFHPSQWGNFYGQIEKLIYETGTGGPYNDPVADLADGSLSSGGSDLIVWLKGGATYEWRNKETTAGWSLSNGNSAGGNITDSSGVIRTPISAQSSLILNSKNNIYVNALGLGTANGLYVGGNVGIGTTSPGAKLEVTGNLKFTAGSGASITFQDGSVQSTAYTGITCGGDYAESVAVTGERSRYEPGDLLVIDPDNPVTS